MKARTKEILFSICLLLGLLILCFYDISFQNKTFKITTANPQALYTGPYGQAHNKPAYFPIQSTDSSQMEEPLFEFVRQSLRKGTWPLWNPHQGCGFPIIAMIEMGMFFPLNFILYAFGQPFSWDIMIFARFFFAGFFTYWFMRTLKLGRIPSLGAALIFMLSGPMVLLQYWFTNVEIIAPLLLLTLERLIHDPTRRNAGFVALAVGLTFFGGHPEHILFVNSFGFLYFLFRIITLKAFKKEIFRHLVLAYILGISLSAMTLFPFLYNVKTELWHSHSTKVALDEGTNDKKELISIITPYYFQAEPVQRNFDRVGWWGGYIGILPFVLALLSLFGKQKRGLNYFLAILAFLNITKTYFDFPFFQLIEVLPFFRNCRFYPHTVHLFAFSIAILAGMGIRLILLKKDLFKKALCINLPLIGIIILVLMRFKDAPHYSLSLQASILGVKLLAILQLILWLNDKGHLRKKIVGLLLLLVIVVELFLYIPRERAKRFDSFPKTPYIEFIKNVPERVRAYGIFYTLSPNTASAYQVDDLGIFISLLSKRLVNFINHLVIINYFKKNLNTCSLQALPLTFDVHRQPFLDMINLGFTVAPKNPREIIANVTYKNFPKPIYTDEVGIYPSLAAFSRVFIVHRAFFEPDEEKMFARILQIHKNFRQIAIIQHRLVPEIMDALDKAPVTDQSNVQIAKYLPNDVILKAKMENPGLVVLSDTFHSDWKASIDGKPTEVYFTNGLIRSVFVPSGEHTIRFVFRPISFYVGILLSLISALLIGWILRRRKTLS